MSEGRAKSSAARTARGGGGYLPSLGTGHGVVSLEGGFEGGKRVRWSAGWLVAPRIHGSPAQAAFAAGGAAQVLFHVARTDSNGASLAIGPRFSAESLSPPPPSPGAAR